jgi:hypothetical protein
MALSLEIGSETGAPFSDFNSGPAATSAEITNIQVAEVANECLAIIPDTDENSPLPSLLVWIPQPGRLNKEALKKAWLDQCQKNNVILLAPQSTDDKKWSPDEVDFVISAINTLEKKTSFNRDQIVVSGRDAGGAMASLIAFGQRSMFKGLAMIDANLSKRIQTVSTSPVQPLLVYLGTSQELNEKQKESVDLLQRARFPVHIESKTGRASEQQWADELLKWTQTVDRL